MDRSDAMIEIGHAVLAMFEEKVLAGSLAERHNRVKKVPLRLWTKECIEERRPMSAVRAWARAAAPVLLSGLASGEFAFRVGPQGLISTEVDLTGSGVTKRARILLTRAPVDGGTRRWSAESFQLMVAPMWTRLCP